MGKLESSMLNNGVRILTDRRSDANSVSLGVWVQVGSRDEPRHLSGVSHFLEHLLAKGTANRSGIEIAEKVDEMGGELNPFTTREHTCLFAHVRDVDAYDALELLLELLVSPALDRVSVENERQVILEEIRANESQGEWVAHEALLGAMFKEHPLGNPILGDPERLAAIGKEDIRAFHRNHYCKSNALVVAGVGAVDHDDVVEQVCHALESLVPQDRSRAVLWPYAPPGEVNIHRPVEQAYVAVGVPGLAANDPDRYALEALTYILGGGMAGRFVTEIRERRGIAYEAYSYQDNFTDAGIVSLHANVAPKSASQAIEVALETLASLTSNSITQRELARAKRHLSGRLALDLEDTAVRMEQVALPVLHRASAVSENQDYLRMYDLLTLDNIERCLSRLSLSEPTIVTVRST